MRFTRTVLHWLAIAGIVFSVIASCLAILNLVNTDPVDFHRLRDLFIAFSIFALLVLVTHKTPKSATHRAVTKCRALLDHPKAFGWIAGIMLVLYVVDACTQHLAFQTASHDFSMIDEAVYSAA